MNVEAYSSELENREDIENALLTNQVKALVATTALGMGFDKPDLSFVIHFQAPGSVIAYYQQVGRAGRAIETAHGVLLHGEEDADITNFFIDRAFPSEDEVDAVLTELERAPEGLSERQLESRANIRSTRIKHALQLLSLESPAPIVKDGTKWQLTASDLSPSFWERARRLTELRRAEHRQMQEYAALGDGHMEFLIRALDGVPETLTHPPAHPLPTSVGRATVIEAIAFLRGNGLPIDPRAQWPAGGLPSFGVSGGNIRLEHRPEPGKALSVWSDGGWGRLVSDGKYRDGRFPDELVAASAELIRSWNPEPAPAWITCIPSLRHPHLVPDFARRVAERLALPFQVVLEKTDNRPEQKTMENSAFQARNVDGSLRVRPGTILPGPVLLVDDMVDSRWTMTVATWLLRTGGADRVIPFALALSGR